MRAHPAVLESGHLSGFYGSLRRLCKNYSSAGMDYRQSWKCENFASGPEEGPFPNSHTEYEIAAK